MTRVRTAIAGGLTTLALCTPLAGAAQSLTAVRGLGYPLQPVDARVEALGGLGIGLFGLAGSLADPTAGAGVNRRGAVLAVAATERTTALGDVSAHTGTTRFPLMRLFFPAGPVVVTGGYGAFLDQSWSVVREGSQPVSAGTVSYRDVLESVGGVGQARVGAAVPLGERVAVGVSLGAYTGGQEVRISREFDTTSIGSLRTYQELRRSRYTGTLAQVGLRWDPVDALRLAANVTWGGTLRADSAAGPVTSRAYQLPLQVGAGASASLGPGVMAAMSGRWSGWSVTDASGGLVDPGIRVTATDTWEIGGGIEFDAPEERPGPKYPVRLGFQYRQLPFTFVSDRPTEWLASAGLGVRIGADPNTPLARADLAIQRGARTAAGDATVPALNETVWRFALSISIFGT